MTLKTAGQVISFLIFCTAFVKGNAQNNFTYEQEIIAPLKLKLKSHGEDTAGVSILLDIATQYKFREPDSAMKYSKLALAISEKLKWEIGIAESLASIAGNYFDVSDYDNSLKYYSSAKLLLESLEPGAKDLDLRRILRMKNVVYNNTGLIYDEQSDYEMALRYYKLAMEVGTKLGKKNGIQLTNIGLIYYSKGNFPKAIEYLLNALKTFDEKENQFEIAACYSNLGLIYCDQNDFERAIEYHQKSLKTSEQGGAKEGMAIAYSNIGNVFLSRAHKIPTDEKSSSRHHTDSFIPQALHYYQKALRLYEDLGAKQSIAGIYENTGNLYRVWSESLNTKIGEPLSNRQKDLLHTALEYYQKALKISSELNIKESAGGAEAGLGVVYSSLDKYADAEKHFITALSIFDSIGNLAGKADVCENMSIMYEAKGEHKKAFEYYKLKISFRDSINNEENVKKQTQLEMQFDFDKQQTADSVRVSEEKKVAAAELRTEKNKSYSLYGGLTLVLIFAGFIFNRFKVTQKQKVIIEEQKVIVEEQKKHVEEKQKEILDSISYARRIQMAQIPGDKGFARILKKVKN